jgi:hypothetical protein
VGPVLDPLLLRKSGSAGNQTRDLLVCSQKLLPLDHRGGIRQDYWVLKSLSAASTQDVLLYAGLSAMRIADSMLHLADALCYATMEGATGQSRAFGFIISQTQVMS